MPRPNDKASGVKLGETSKQEEKTTGHAVHSAGTQTESEHGAHAAAGHSKRPAHKASTSLLKKGGA